MRIVKRKKRILVILLLISCALIILFIPWRQSLVFSYEDTDDILAFMPMGNENGFKMQYTHSIHLTSVVESYKITGDNMIRQYELEYEDFAVGMPADAAKGEKFEVKDGKYRIKNMKRDFPYYDLRVGKVRANHTLIGIDEKYALTNYIEPGTWVRVQIKKLSFIQQLEGVNILNGK
ncbi:DUF1850 domain-containing protein [Mesobacillus zeae]|uniref:DUF1850 domain-containing protein n=1 Tax=Mesobacillus zeae TaxID=1917180 RepID=A0A398B2B6_9BACI|nr:DUF1850 domain-containing protein [Mesobacillus zeae]RID82023.1 DUF1850 domain-containing protein [Mesobacillus zeae]